VRCVTADRAERILQLLRQPHSRQQLAARLGVTAPSLIRAIADLHARGLITREIRDGQVFYRATAREHVG
jgi:predicted ArsR family transcriptional regulator